MLLQKERHESALVGMNRKKKQENLFFNDIYLSIVEKYNAGQPIVIDLCHLNTFKCIDVAVSVSTQLFINSVDAEVKFLVANSQIRKSFNMLNINSKISCEAKKSFNIFNLVV